MMRVKRGMFLLGMLTACMVLAGGGEALAANITHVFDATLSLTGGCSTSPAVLEADPVPDPSCPGGPLPPSGSFSSPRKVTTDSYGDIYVDSYGALAAEGKEGRIDVFDPQGYFITEITQPEPPTGPRDIAVDSVGTLYVFDSTPTNTSYEVVRYEPTTYDPAAGEIAYEAPPVLVGKTSSSTTYAGLAVNPENDHLFVHDITGGSHIVEYSSAAEGNTVLASDIGVGILPEEVASGIGLAIDAAHERIYVTKRREIVALELAPPHQLVASFDGSGSPVTEFSTAPSVAVDESTGHVFIYDGEQTNKVYEFKENREFVATIEHNFQYVPGSEIWVDNGVNSPNGALSPDGRYLFVPSHGTGVGHSFAFGPTPPVGPPVVASTSVSGVTETEARLQASIEPENLATSYTFEYTTQQNFEANGFAGATVAGGGSVPGQAGSVEISAATNGLTPGVAYRFRVRVSNEEGSDEAGAGFVTYPAGPSGACPNDALRTGPSALLPDCRAYELVTPPDTNARAPLGPGHLGLGENFFATRGAAPGGGAVSFRIEGGAFQGANATGSFAGDPYLSERGADGWTSSYVGPSATEATAVVPGSNSPDQRYSFWKAEQAGSAVIDGDTTFYIRYPDGHSALIGRGTLGTDPRAIGRLISENGTHVIFTSSVPLEEKSPAEGTSAVYDRTTDPVTHAEVTNVASLLPGDETPSADAAYKGASLDGVGIAFTVGPTLYFRYNNKKTFDIADGVTFAGISEGGRRIFYLEAGKLKAFDAITESTIVFNSSGSATPVNVSPDGTTAYFASLNGLSAGVNPLGAKPKAGQWNLYRSREGVLSFVGTVTARDVDGEEPGNEPVDGLGLWTYAVGVNAGGNAGRFGEDPSRTTPDGHALLFQSRAALAGYDPEGHSEIYRYDAAAGALQCISCNPTGAVAGGEASLQSVSQDRESPEPSSSFALIPNLRADGRRAIFQSTEKLVASDTDGLQDVYEWEDDGVGSCARAGGCVYLISSGHSGHPDYLYAISDSGDDAFFLSSDLLVGADQDETPSIYDAHVGGGFPEAAEGECEGEGCRPTLSPPPSLTSPAKPAGGAHDNLRPRCPKGRRKVRRHGKVRCVKKHGKHHHRRANTKKKGARR